MTRHFTQKDIEMASKYMKKCPILLVIREMQVKTTIRYTTRLFEYQESKRLT